VEELAANLRLLLENPEMRKAFGTAAREYCVQHFSWEVHAEQLNKMYREVIDSTKN
jgi:glycosyltransferase involved in cell wall biosynthesis